MASRPRQYMFACLAKNVHIPEKKIHKMAMDFPIEVARFGNPGELGVGVRGVDTPRRVVGLVFN